MFVYSVRASTLRFALVVFLTLGILITALALGGATAVSVSAGGEIRFGGIRTNEDRLEFINQFVELSGEPIEVEKFTVPENFDRIIAGYNEIQKSQGLNLNKYKNKRVTRYTYRIDGYEDYSGEVNVNLFIYRNTVVACDVSSLDPGGFVLPLIKL